MIHRLLRQPGGFECFGSLLEHPKASDLPVLDRVHERTRRRHFSTFSCDIARSVSRDGVALFG
jgi:hypothetical protein